MMPWDLAIRVSTRARRAARARRAQCQRAARAHRAAVRAWPSCRLLHDCARSAERLLRAPLILPHARWLQDNKLTGPIPSEIYGIEALVALYVARRTAAP